MNCTYMKQKTTSCIVPFYNEKGRLEHVLKELIKVKKIGEIICVDDGSTDGGVNELKKNFPTATFLRLEKNQGKTAAVRAGINKARNDYIFLCDADILGLDYKTIEKAIDIITENSNIEMILLKGKFVFPSSIFSRSELIFSGDRILRKKILKEILSTKISAYQLEIAINDHMIKNNKNVYWVQTEIENIRKSRKYGFLKGLIGDLKMVGNVVSFGLMKYIFQILFFARKNSNNRS